MQLNMAARKLPGAEAEKQRQLLREAIQFKNYEFNTHGVELDQRYESGAVVPDGTPAPVNPRGHELYHHPTSFPGAKIPHAWLGRGTKQLSTLDIGGRGRFALLTGIGGEPWIDAAGAVSAALSVEIMTASIGPGGDYEDLYGDWAALREVEDTGCVLLRPDNYVAYRSPAMQPDPGCALGAALRHILAVDIE
jgi:2,4-dichlorophenol 6-monooxygenase